MTDEISRAHNTHLQAVAKAISDMLNDPDVGDGEAARIVEWAWRVAALGDGCESKRADPDEWHTVWPTARLGNMYAYECPTHPSGPWRVGWSAEMINPSPWRQAT